MFKKFKIFGLVALLAATTMVFMSCSKESKIEGKWKITKASPSEIEDDKGETWTFKEGGSWSGVIDGLDVDGDWTISKDDLTISTKMESYKVTGEFSIDELKKRSMSLSGKWTVKFDGESESMKANYEFEKK